jgi:superfamily II DNA/RNA helicase
MNRKVIQLSQVRYVVLDEADEMLNMGFKEDIDAVLETTPIDKNVWLFSATMPTEVARIAKTYMNDPLEVSIGHKNQSNENIDHIYYMVKERDRYEAVKRLIDFNPSIYGLIFCRTKNETATVAEKLGREGYNAEPLHGDLTQAMRDRVMERFRSKELQILATQSYADIAPPSPPPCSPPAHGRLAQVISTGRELIAQWTPRRSQTSPTGGRSRCTRDQGRACKRGARRCLDRGAWATRCAQGQVGACKRDARTCSG